jgi:hypothetical protein
MNYLLSNNLQECTIRLLDSNCIKNLSCWSHKISEMSRKILFLHQTRLLKNKAMQIMWNVIKKYFCISIFQIKPEKILPSSTSGLQTHRKKNFSIQLIDKECSEISRKDKISLNLLDKSDLSSQMDLWTKKEIFLLMKSHGFNIANFLSIWNYWCPIVQPYRQIDMRQFTWWESCSSKNGGKL